MTQPEDYLNLDHTEHRSLFSTGRYVWDALKVLPDFFNQQDSFTDYSDRMGEPYIEKNVSIGKGTKVEHGAVILGPAVIGKNCLIRSGAYIRDHVVIGDDCLIGKSVELKYSILLNGCQVPHFNYVGDSILGFKAHLGAGVKISNYKLIPSTIKVEIGEDRLDTGLMKFGAVLGDRAEIGCNTVLNPGSLIGRDCILYPNIFWRGHLKPHQIVKNCSEIEISNRTMER